MKKLTYPQIDNMDLWDRIVSRKHQPAKGNLMLVRDQVKERYVFYSEHIHDLDKIIPLPQTTWSKVKEELISCYGKNAAFDEIRKKIFDNLKLSNQIKCPYCLLSRPNTLEHYFDKDDYPEFSVYVPNLIPCCSECNSSKNTSMFDTHNNRKYIHFYHDLIPEEQFLFARFTFSEFDFVPIINLTLNFHEKNYYSDLIERHFEALSLLKKYKSTIVDRLAPVLEEIKIHHASNMSLETITTILQNKLISLSKYYGNNYWETCMYEGILNSPGFLSQVLSS